MMTKSMFVTFPQRWVRERHTVWRYWTQRLLPPLELTPLRIASAYALFGTFGLFVSDVVFVWYFSDPLLSQIQALKGGAEVLLTAGFIFILVKRRESQLQRSMTQLDQQREKLDVLHRVLRHNLRNDLNVILGSIWQIREQDPSIRFERQCETIRNTVDKILHYTDQATRIKQLTDNNGRIRTCDATKMVAELEEASSREHSDSDISVTLPERALVEVNPLFETALEELVTNAIEHNDSETPRVTIDVRTEDTPSHMVEIEVADNGPGIPEAELKPLREGKEEQIFHLTGLGLWFVKWTVRHSGGELIFEDRDPRGTAVIVRVPKAPEELSSSLSLLNAD